MAEDLIASWKRGKAPRAPNQRVFKLNSDLSIPRREQNTTAKSGSDGEWLDCWRTRACTRNPSRRLGFPEMGEVEIPASADDSWKTSQSTSRSPSGHIFWRPETSATRRTTEESCSIKPWYMVKTMFNHPHMARLQTRPMMSQRPRWLAGHIR